MNFYLVQAVHLRQHALKLFQGGWYNFCLAGIDTSTLKDQSRRLASTSRAKALGIPTKEILKRSHWFRCSIFQKHSCKGNN